MPDDFDSKRATDDNPKLRLLALSALAGSAGWHVYCRRVGEVVKEQIDKGIFDVDTPDELRRDLVRVRKLYVDQFSPEKLLKSLVSVAENEARMEERK